MKKYLLEVIVFIAGFGIMVFELVGSRVLAPYVGTTIIVWSVLIGVILAFLSAGYWLGGKKADKKPDFKHLSFIILLAAFFVGLTAAFKTPLINFLDQYFTSFQWEAVVLSVILFGPASFFMAAVSPYAVRLRLHSVSESGETVGELSAIAAVGSIVGAFSAGVILVPLWGNTAILFGLAAILFLASILAFWRSLIPVKTAMLFLALGLVFSGNSVDEYFLPIEFTNSAYLDIAVLRGTYTYKDLNTGENISRPIRQIYTSPLAVQSAVFADTDDDLVLPYSKFFRVLPEFFLGQNYRALLIGGAGYSIPKDFLKINPEGEMDVVEIDPKMTEVARKYFGLKDDPRLSIYHEDGRTYINKNKKKYDVVMIDSFRAFDLPHHLTTIETMKKINDFLAPDGLLLVNVNQSIKGDTGKFFRAEYATLKKVFPQLYVFTVNSPNPDEVQNLIIAASKSPERVEIKSGEAEENLYFEREWKEEIVLDMPILTDDYSPVAHYMLAAGKTVK